MVFSQLKIYITIILALVGMTGLYWFVEIKGITDLIADIDTLIVQVRSSGSIGPLLVIGLMMLAVVFNPLPSAPIALASGAVYGHTWGTIYIIIGAFAGAAIAFMIARLTGHQFLHRITATNNWSLGRFGSQNSLMAIIFISRLMPFMSFDLVSYAAGLTSISFWRFCLATLLGLIPMSFLLAHFGGEMLQADLKSLALFVLAAGLITLPPVIYNIYIRKNRSDLKE